MRGITVMRRFLRLHWLALWVGAGLISLSARAEVSITPAEGSFHVKASGYEATVGADGCLTSVQAGGVEFLKSDKTFPRGVYPFQDGLLPAAQVIQAASNVVVATGAKATARYQFAPGGITCTLSNGTAKPLLLVGVLDTNVTVAMDGAGRFAKTPANRSWETVTWFRDGASLRLRGGTKVWGPWSGQHQVWQSDIPARGSRTVEFEPGAAKPAEVAAAQQFRAAPPPPPPADPVGPMWDMKKLGSAPKVFTAEGITEPGVKALFFEGEPYQDRPTRVFAWMGIPAVKKGKKLPAMVLVHGGGGTAFADWVRLWNERGYAAIAMDTCGCVPVGKYSHWQRHEHGGPAGWGGFEQIDEPREDQWTYHAVAAALRAHSLLRAQPEVDAERIGLTGISWGGYLTCILAGVDHRYKLAVPVYGCGYYLETVFGGNLGKLSAEQRARWMRWWDPSAYLQDAPMSLLWVTGSNDFAYTFDALQKSYRLPKSARTLAIRLRMPHGHGGAGEKPKEIHVFADSILKGGDPLLRLGNQGHDGRKVWATFQGAHPVVKAELNITRGTGRWQERKWEALPAVVEANGQVTATLPEGVTVYYLNVFDDRDCAISTEHEELQP